MGAPPPKSGASSDISYDEDEPDEKNEWRPNAAAPGSGPNADAEDANAPSSQAAPVRENSVVPPLPELSGLGNRPPEAAPKAAPTPADNADEANEVSSEEI